MCFEEAHSIEKANYKFSWEVGWQRESKTWIKDMKKG
jgi:hypothetical protein